MPRRVKALVREQTIGGAYLVFAFSRAHYSSINIERISRAYASLSDAQRPHMEGHMNAAIEPATSLIGFVLDDKEGRARHRAVAQGEGHVQDASFCCVPRCNLTLSFAWFL